MVKRIIRKVVGVVGGIAATLFFLVKWSTDTEILVNIVSFLVAIICAVVYSNLDDDNTGFWPPKPDSK